MCCSMSIHILIVWTSLVVSMHLQLKVRIFSGNSTEYIVNPNIYWRHKYISIFSSFGGNICMKLLWEPGRKQSNKGATIVPNRNQSNTNIPLIFITTYSRANPNFKELFSQHWSYLGRSSATGELGNQDFKIIYRKLPSLKDMLVKERIAQPTTTLIKGCNRPKTCQYCGKISQSGKVKNLNNNKTYNTFTNGTCQSNNLIYCL